MKLKTKVQIIVAVICFVFCFTVTLQYKSVTRNNTIKISKSSSDNELETKLLNANQQVVDLKKENMQLTSDIDIYRQQVASNDSGAAALKEELDKYITLSGFTNVKGPGITIEVTDSKQAQADTDYSSELIVHDSDIRSLVNELFGAGAEAVSVNGERIIVNTSIRCVGNTIMINNKRCSSPYIVKAIGDKDALDSALNMRGGIADELKRSTIDVNVTKSDKIQIGKYTGTVTFSYAQDYEKQVK